MSLAQIADVAYTMLADQADRQTATDRLLAGFVVAMGGTADIPEWDEARRRLDAMLEAPLTPVDTDRQDLLDALGVVA